MQTTDFAALAASGSLAHNAENGTIPHDDGWIAEPKFDGWCIFALVGEGKVDFYSRSGKMYNGKLPKVEAELLAALPPGSVVVGEAVALRMEGTKVINEWGTAQSALTVGAINAAAEKITFMVFDLLAHRGIDARPLGFGQRRALLEKIFESNDFEKVALTVQVAPTKASYAALVAQGFEGIMLKRLNAPYASGKRGAGQVKIKHEATADVIVTGFKPGKNGFEGLVGALEFGQYDDCSACNGSGAFNFTDTCPECGGTGKRLVPRGRCSGMDMRTRIQITNQQEKWLGRVIEIRFNGLINGSFRHPRFVRVRDDKAPEQVTLHDA